MPRGMSPEKEAELAELGRFIDWFSSHIKGIPERAPHHTHQALQKIEARFGRSKALAGFRQAVNDVIEMTAHQPPEWVAEFDSACQRAGVLSLSQVRARYWSKYAAVLKRGRIRNDTEFFLVMGLLNDLSSPLTASERASLESMVASYEKSAA
jgi:hypothetical protein